MSEAVSFDGAQPGFTAGLAMRVDAAARILHQAFGGQANDEFAAADLRAWRNGPKSFAPETASPKSFRPADPNSNPTEGWDPFAAAAASEPDHRFVDPVAAAHAAGYAEGVAAAIAEGKVRAAADAALLDRLGAALRSDARLDRERMARQLRQTVLYLVSRIIGEAGVSAELLGKRVTAATELLADAAESAMLRVHPEDVALLAGLLPESVFPVGDAAIARGSFVLEAASTIVEDGPELWLEQLAQAIDRVAVPC